MSDETGSFDLSAPIGFVHPVFAGRKRIDQRQAIALFLRSRHSWWGSLFASRLVLPHGGRKVGGVCQERTRIAMCS